MMNLVRKMAAKRATGATALEYGILVALIALAITVGVGVFGDNLNNFFNDITISAGSVG